MSRLGHCSHSGLSKDQIDEGMCWAFEQRAAGLPVYVYCTHGHARSAVMMCALLIADGIAADPEDAKRTVAARRPGIRPNKRQWAALDAWWHWRKQQQSQGNRKMVEDV